MSLKGRFLLRSVRENYYQGVVRAINELQCDVEYQNREKWTALLIGCENGNERVVSFLLSQGANIHTTNRNNDDALCVAVKNQHINIVKMILKRAKELNVRGYIAKYDFSALHTACNLVNEELVKLILSNVANLDINFLIDGKAPLHIAILKDNLNIVQLLLDNGSKPDLLNSDSLTPLQYAAISGSIKLVEMLLTSGADINFPIDNERQTPLYYACFHVHPAIANLLITNRAKILYFFEFHDFSSNILDILEEVLLKHLAAGILPITNVVIAFVVRGFSFFPIFQKCEIELANMKQMNIADTNVTFYDIFMKHPRILTVYFRNKSVLQALEAYNFKDNFEYYGDMLKLNVTEASRRIRLYNQCLAFFSYITTTTRCPQLPILCIDHILSYLPNSAIENMIKSGRVIRPF